MVRRIAAPREEAGLIGRVGKPAIGSYQYEKRLSAVICTISIYPLEVEQQLDDGRDKGERDPRRLTPSESARRIADKNLRGELLRSSKLLGRKKDQRSRWVYVDER